MADMKSTVQIRVDSRIQGLPSEPSSWPRIFQVPHYLRTLNKEADEPRIISIGPYHHQKVHLKAMETHKVRFLKDILRRRDESSAERCVEAVTGMVNRARNCYSESLVISDEEFLEMMVLDGCFIVELIHKFDEGSWHDPILNVCQIYTNILKDLRLVENPLPFFVPYLMREYKKAPRNGGFSFVRSATELREAGIKFKKVQGGSLFDIKFENGTLKIPAVTIEDATEILYRNIISCEQFDDISANEEVAEMFNRLGTEVIVNKKNFFYAKLFNGVNRHYHTPWNKRMASLRHNYFNTPWALVSFVAANFLLLLSLLQISCFYFRCCKQRSQISLKLGLESVKNL
ncbi:hypothetical protein SLEP1_g32426 [Rubroshorea leprosula]|uniref:Uncharacterized protein n=1 Tax=Rubroshorea leprosula TaxID=152421 RepID=A0AAV5KDF6_9ROSI|nr:hypothetical protein SLEP1_g32426 [Rubroshorea leprosula]